MNLLKFAMSTMYFQFDGQHYQQVYSVPMRSPVSIIVSDMFMEHMEEEAMDTAQPDMTHKILCWYIDDSFEVFHTDKYELAEHLNTID